jgi:hypothetical protein
VLLDLATSRGVTRLVTTNFDLLFEASNPTLRSFGPQTSLILTVTATFVASCICMAVSTPGTWAPRTMSSSFLAPTSAALTSQ